MSGENTPFRVTQDFEVLLPKHDKVFPIPCNEWDLLQSQIDELRTEPWFFHTAGSLLVGASVATLISIMTDAVGGSEYVAIIARAIAWSCGITGAACLFFAHKERSVHRAQARLIATQMKLIAERFDRK